MVIMVIFLAAWLQLNLTFLCDTKSRYWLFGAAMHSVTKPGILMPVP